MVVYKKVIFVRGPRRRTSVMDIIATLLGLGFLWARLFFVTHGHAGLAAFLGDVEDYQHEEHKQDGGTATAPILNPQEADTSPSPLIKGPTSSATQESCQAGEVGCNQSAPVLRPPPEDHAAANPIWVGHIILASVTPDGLTVADGPMSAFHHDEVRFIRFSAQVSRNGASPSTIDDEVTVLVKFISPSGRILRGHYRDGDREGDSPEGFSYPIGVHFRRDESTALITAQWGADRPGVAFDELGVWWIEFYYDNRAVGRVTFEID